MNQQELSKKLSNEGVSRSAYALDGEMPYEQYAIEKSSGKWFVYYSERRHRSSEQFFDSEDDACDYLYSLYTKGPSN